MKINLSIITDRLSRIQLSNNGVVLLEGTREVPEEEMGLITDVASKLANDFPRIVFRTGNATGSDEAFASGIAQVDSSRLEYVLPHAGMGRKRLAAGSKQVAFQQATVAERDMLSKLTLQASPIYQNLAAGANRSSQMAAKFNYLLRDTLKVQGCSSLGLAPAHAGLFFVNTKHPGKGGTGHTVRVCELLDVPVWTQDVWLNT